jgi:hypothetical protein
MVGLMASTMNAERVDAAAPSDDSNALSFSPSHVNVTVTYLDVSHVFGFMVSAHKNEK